MGNHIQLMKKTWDIIESREWHRLEEVVAPGVEFRIHDQTFRGVKEFAAMLGVWYSAFPDLRHDLVAEVETGETYACELVMRATHTGPFKTPKGDLPATGKTVAMRSCDYATIQGGRIQTWHAYPDMLGLLAQLGVG